MASDYVAPGPGGFVVVVGGQQIGTFPTQAAAEQAFNDVTGQSNAPAATATAQTYQTPNGPKTLQEMQDGLHGAGWNGDYSDPASVIAAYNSTASGTGTSTTTTTSSAQNLLDAVASGDQARIDEATREFNMTFAENQRQYDSTNYTNLATSLLNGAVQLHGPQDYWDFQAFTSGGRDLMSQMFSNQPRADFSAPTGTIQPETIDDLMQKLGFTTAPGAGSSSSSGTPGTYNTVNGAKTPDQMYQELKAAGWAGSATDTNAIVAAYAQTTGHPVTPSTASTSTTTAPPVHAQPTSTPPPAAVQPAPTATTNAVGGTPRGDTPTAATASVPGLTPNAVTPAMGTAVTPGTGQTSAGTAPSTLTDAMRGAYQSQVFTGNKGDPSTWGGATPTAAPGSQAYTATTGGGYTGTAAPAVVSPVSATLNAVSGTPRGDAPAAPATQTPSASFATPTAGAPRGDAEVAGYTPAMVTGNPNTPGVPNVILPYQWNPAVFDALGPTGQGLLKSTVEAQGWDWDEYLRQINASRPQGTAPKTSTTTFSTPMGSFS